MIYKQLLCRNPGEAVNAQACRPSLYVLADMTKIWLNGCNNL
ncbi:hypothetical protein CLOBOL_05877 [Enterocloster bolteae ATCC BAA-613]|uniref:Uncharacterized protein n=1 Tax=Enterocloster bolteae (strain ATCC BAA-613 / DSM 15670 / CCUG 46953 / JCM 12243 / WAL 16351) TaxID=411902 RepID=A8S178_ENTBW|nr:hypothetical protein CLOBOL_05877 [Enterocloster bolteae ATCC BAA-613]